MWTDKDMTDCVFLFDEKHQKKKKTKHETKEYVLELLKSLYSSPSRLKFALKKFSKFVIAKNWDNRHSMI